MKVLLDTNIIIHREASHVIVPEIGKLFFWLDRLKYEKCIHPSTIDEIRKHKDKKVVKAFETKLESYVSLKTIAHNSPAIDSIRKKYDNTLNDEIDTSLLNEVYSKRVDLLITEDRKIHKKAAELGISEKVFIIDSFLEKVVAEHPDLVEYKVLSVKKEYFGNLDINDPFFDSFKEDYVGFVDWFNRKSDEIAYVCKGDDDDVLAFLYVKVEDKNENYRDIEPKFVSKRRLKVGTFKVIANGFKLGERFLKIIFDNALQFNVEEIYVTIFNKTVEQQRLTQLMEDWGFSHYGSKVSKSGEEQVYTRYFAPIANIKHPNLTYPYLNKNVRKYIAAIYPEYHTELFPDSILRTESPHSFIENRPNRNAINKVFISRSWLRNMNTGDLVVFYRTASSEGSGHYTSVTTTVGLIQKVILNIRSEKQFIELSRKRSVFTDKELSEYWNFNPNSRPFIVNFSYICSLPRRLNLNSLLELKIISRPPRGFDLLSDNAFQLLMEKSNADKRLIVD